MKRLVVKAFPFLFISKLMIPSVLKIGIGKEEKWEKVVFLMFNDRSSDLACRKRVVKDVNRARNQSGGSAYH